MLVASKPPRPGPRIEAWILAGGLGTRLGRDKSRVRLGRLTMPGWIRATASQAGLKVRLLRRDEVARCGPLGGILTALRQSRADVLLFLACDMPFVPASLLRRLIRSLRASDPAVMVETNGRVGFPLLLRRAASRSIVELLVTENHYSLQGLASALTARRLPPGRRQLSSLLNVNSPGDLAHARSLLKRRDSRPPAKIPDASLVKARPRR